MNMLRVKDLNHRCATQMPPQPLKVTFLRPPPPKCPSPLSLKKVPVYHEKVNAQIHGLLFSFKRLTFSARHYTPYVCWLSVEECCQRLVKKVEK